MRYFLDTEFIEGFRKPLFGKHRHFIDLISIGVVCEDGRKYHAISNEWNYYDADEWVQKNVIIPLYISTVHGDAKNQMDAQTFKNYFGKPNKQIAKELLEFFGCWRDHFFWRASEGIKVYGYYADYDWVLFCSLFGRMVDLPKGFPMYCRDLKQMADEKYGDSFEKIKKQSDYPKQTNEHNALEDAKWNYELYKYLTKNK